MKWIAVIGISQSTEKAHGHAPAPSRRHQKYARNNDAGKPQRTDGIGSSDNCLAKPSPQIEEGEKPENGDTEGDGPQPSVPTAQCE
jgi:hypothetical protein